MSETGVVKGFKVFNPDWTCSPNGNTKQYTCPGKFEEDITPIRCGRGMHFCKKAADCFNYYNFNPENKVAEVVAYAVVIAFIANETISIIENAGLMGVPIPSVIVKAIEVLKKKAESEDKENE